MRNILILAVSLTSVMVATPQDSGRVAETQENIIILKYLRARLDPNWVIIRHDPNGEYASFVSAVLTDELGKPRNDKSMILFGVFDVSGHDGLTKFELMTRKHEKKNEHKAGAWLINHAVEPKDDGFALVIDALQYSEEYKSYLWARRGRRIETSEYTLNDEDVKDIVAFTKRIDLITRPGLPETNDNEHHGSSKDSSLSQ